QDVVSKCLKKDRNQRYSTINDLEKDLVHARQEISNPTAWPLLDKTVRRPSARSHRPKLRRRWLVSAAIFVAVAGIVATAGHFLVSHRVASSSQPQINSLAVLPLKPFDARDNSLGLGIADALIRKISQTGRVVVRPTSSVRRYLNDDTDALAAGRQLNADAVLEGSVQRDSDQLRIVVNLMRTVDGFSLWSQQFDMHQADVFTIQDTMAQQIASRLRLQLDNAQQSRLTKDYTSNTRAYDFYSKAIYNLEQRGFGISTKPQMDETIDLFRKAIAEDPNYALAHAELAYAYAWTALFIEPQDSVWGEQAQAEINRAQEIDPQLAETHIARYLMLWSGYGGWQVEAAIRELQVAQQLNPNVGHTELGSLYQHVGLEDFAAREFKRGLEIDPTSDLLKDTIVMMHNIVRDYDNELSDNQKYFPSRGPSVWYLLSKGRLNDVQELIDKSGSKIDWLPQAKGLLFALKKDFVSAEREIPGILSQFPTRDPEYHHATYDVACIYALEGNSKEAVKWLTETAASGFSCYPLFGRDPYLNRIRSASEFVQFMTRMKEQNDKYRRVAEGQK
ncbi:MAG: hypothetical protein C5B44_04075, partial [Acidobacteria bacterium]